MLHCVNLALATGGAHDQRYHGSPDMEMVRESSDA
jgi:hypothetical protein